MADIFISYAREDVDTARRLAEALAGQDWSVWWDRQLSAGQHFERLIETQLKAARCVVVLWSAAAVESDWVQDEAAYARDRQRLVPAWLEPVDLPFRFARLHTVDLVGWRGDASHAGFRRLVEDISGLLAAPARPGEAEHRQAEQEATKAEEEQRRRNEAEARSKAEKEHQRAEALRALEQAHEEEAKREVEEARKHREQQEAEARRRAEEEERERQWRVQRSAEVRQEAEEARKRAETEAHQAAEEQQREAQWRREDEAWRAAEAARVPKLARKNDARGWQRLKLMPAVGLVVLVGLAGVLAWQQWPTQEPAEPAQKDQEKEIAPAAPDPERVLKPLDTFTDCRECPEMVMIPGGTFVMGSPEDEEGHSSDESPQHRVTIAPFAMGKTEVTFAEWDACVAGGGCNGYKPPDGGWGRGSRPVINVSWRDAQAYVDWLERETGKPYRLPSEAEWEYACRAGTTTPFSFGATISTDQANYDGNYTYGKGTEGEYRAKTIEVGSFPPNPWGLYDMHGNV